MVLGEKGTCRGGWDFLTGNQMGWQRVSVCGCMCVLAGRGEGCGLWERCRYLFFSHCPLLTHVMENFIRWKSLKYLLNVGNVSSWRADPAFLPALSFSHTQTRWCSLCMYNTAVTVGQYTVFIWHPITLYSHKVSWTSTEKCDVHNVFCLFVCFQELNMYKDI